MDVSIVGKEDEEEIIRLQQEKLKEEQKTKSPPAQIKNRGRPRRPELPVKTTRTTTATAATSAITSNSKKLQF